MTNEIKYYLNFPKELDIDLKEIKFELDWNEKSNEVTFIS